MNNKLALIGMIIGFIAGGFGMIAAIQTSPIFGSVMTIVFVGIFAWGFLTLKGFSDDNKLLQTGIPAEATILKSWDTGVTLNYSPRIGMILEVKPKNKPKYEVKINKFISRLQTNYFNPGRKLKVRIDPNNPKRIAFESIGEGSDL